MNLRVGIALVIAAALAAAAATVTAFAYIWTSGGIAHRWAETSIGLCFVGFGLAYMAHGLLDDD